MYFTVFLQGDWVPNEFGGDANLQAISFLQELNWVVHRQFPGVFTMAEESTSWKGVTDRESGTLKCQTALQCFDANVLF